MEKIDFCLDKAVYVAKEFRNSLRQTILVPQNDSFNGDDTFNSDEAYYLAFSLVNGSLDTSFGIYSVLYKDSDDCADLRGVMMAGSLTKFIPLGYGQLMLKEAEAKMQTIKFLKVKKINKLLDEALDAPAV